jgi:hypothetical protein
MRTDRIYLAMITLGAFTLALATVLAIAEWQERGSTLPELWGVAFADHRDGSTSNFAVKEEETIRKVFAFSASDAARTLEVDNIFGSIDVVGTTSNEAQLVVVKTLMAESKDRLEAARKEVTLDISQNGNDVRLYVNGPFRCKCCNDCTSFHGDGGYVVKMDFQLQIPGRTELKLKTVNEGHIKVQGVAANYSVRNVNGGIEMVDMAGSGIARTVNGPVKVTFRENPRANSEFASLNGNVELYFAKDLSADFRFKTLNGAIYTDYLLTALPPRAPIEERRDGKFVFRTDRYTGGRVGAGGPEIKVENLNGDIRVLERQA